MRKPLTPGTFFKHAMRLPYGTKLENGFYMLPAGWMFTRRTRRTLTGAPFVWWNMLQTVKPVKWS